MDTIFKNFKGLPECVVANCTCKVKPMDGLSQKENLEMKECYENFRVLGDELIEFYKNLVNQTTFKGA